MAETEPGIPVNKKNIKPDSREERIRKYLEEKNRYKYTCYPQRHPPSALAKRLKRRAEQRAFKKMTPEEQKKYHKYGKHRTTRLAFTTFIGLRRYIYTSQVSTSLRREPLFTPAHKFKEKMKIGPLEGKDSWKVDYCPSALETFAGTFNPGTIADKNEIYKETIVKKRRYRHRIRREKFTKPEKPIGEIHGDYISFPLETEQKNKQEKIEISYDEQKSKKFEEKLCDDIHALDQKSAASRALSFDVLRATLSKRLFPDTIVNYCPTIAIALNRTLKKGHSIEKLAAAKLVPIVCIQLGENYCEEFFIRVKSPFIKVIMDKLVDARVRAECCKSLAATSVLASIDMHDMLDLMRMYEKIFTRNYYKNSCNTKECVKANSLIQTAALNSWTLLLAMCAPADVYSLLDGTSSTFYLSLLKLIELLQAPTVEVQTATGIALSLAYELGSEYCIEFGQEKLDTVITKVEQLILDSHKFRAKKNRRIQRKTFKDVLRSLEEKESPVERVRLGKEVLELDRWSSHVVYHRLATALGSGLQVATQTSLLRSILQMGHPVSYKSSQKHNKQEKKKKTPIEWIHVGKETFELDRWASHVQYHRMARERCPEYQVANLTGLVRSVIHREHPIHHEPPQWHNKEKKHLQYAATAKARTIELKKNRDKFYTDFNL